MTDLKGGRPAGEDDGEDAEAGSGVRVDSSPSSPPDTADYVSPPLEIDPDQLMLFDVERRPGTLGEIMAALKALSDAAKGDDPDAHLRARNRAAAIGCTTEQILDAERWGRKWHT